MTKTSTHRWNDASLWFRKALVTTLSGLVLGIVVSITVVLLGHSVFPSISEYGIDAGMRLKVNLDRWRQFGQRMPALESGEEPAGKNADSTFVFLDVDPEYGPGAESGENACAALEESRTPECRTATLNCSSSRPLNRFLLAKLVDTLRKHEARLIVLDVVLANEATVIDECEANALTVALAASSNVPVIYAAPIQLAWQGADGERSNTVRIEHGSSQISGDQWTRGPAAMGAVAFPTADHVVRRYPRCFSIEGEAEPRLSLPALAATIVMEEAPSCTDVDTHGAPRIVFTLPHLAGHQDDPYTDRDTWAYYNRVYNRCLASNFWNTDSDCSQKSMYQGKIVVVGASNPVRRDWHYTPLGNLVGAEVVINAIRSRLQFKSQEHTLASTLGHELLIVVFGAFIWLFFHAWREKTAPAGKMSFAQRGARGAIVTVLFLGTLSVVFVAALFLSYSTLRPAPSLDFLIGVLAISLEQYIEAVHTVVHEIKQGLERLLGLPPDSQGH